MNTTATPLAAGTTQIKVRIDDTDVSNVAIIVAAARRPHIPDLTTQGAIRYALSYTATGLALSNGAHGRHRLAEPN